MMDIEQLYKDETGFNAYYMHQSQKIYYRSYVKWLEKKLSDSLKSIDKNNIIE